MINEFDIKIVNNYLYQISRIHFRSLKQMQEVDNNIRMKQFVPLYAAITKKYRALLSDDVLEEAITYKKMLEGRESMNSVLRNFISFHESEIYKIERRIKMKKALKYAFTNDISYKQAKDLLGISIKTYYDFVNGRKELSYNRMVKLTRDIRINEL